MRPGRVRSCPPARRTRAAPARTTADPAREHSWRACSLLIELRNHLIDFGGVERQILDCQVTEQRRSEPRRHPGSAAVDAHATGTLPGDTPADLGHFTLEREARLAVRLAFEASAERAIAAVAREKSGQVAVVE